MLRIITSTSAAAAKSYFVKGFSRQDYYVDGQEIVGHWGGKGAAKLGLQGLVNADAFNDLCDNYRPGTQEHLTPRTKSVRRVGFDMSFAATKSVSLLYAVTGDERILKAFRESVEETMRDMEMQARARVRKDGQDFDRVTGNLTWAEFVHFTTRPVEGTPDPHLHSHMYVFNASYDPDEQRWKAAQVGEIKRDAPKYEAIFQNRLATKLIEMGYPIERKAKAFEIQGMKEKMLRRFSRRTAQIDAVAEARGITDPEERAALGAATREKKATNLTPGQLHEMYLARLTSAEREHIEHLYRHSMAWERGIAPTPDNPALPGEAKRVWSAKRSEPGTPSAAEREALEFGIMHCFERESVVSESRIIESALRFGVGHINYEALQAAMDKHPKLLRQTLDGRTYITTPEVVREEREMIEWVKFGRGMAAQLAPGHVIQDKRLTEEQRAAVRHVLESTDMVTGIHGRAGTGKTTVMVETIQAIEASGRKTLIFAPTSEAARDVLRKEGFKDAETVALLLVSEKLQQEAKGSVIWIDEAGLLSARTMSKVAHLAQDLQARVVVTGDPMQHRPIERGDAFRVLTEHAGLQLAELTEIQRQRGMYREAVFEASHGDMVKSFQILDKMNAIREIADEERYKVLADDYLEAVRKKATALVVAPTHSEIRKVTERIREDFKKDGRLGEERDFHVLRRVDMTEAMRADVRSYREGWVVEMMKAVPGIAQGSRLEVEAIENHGLVVRDEAGHQHQLDAKRYADRFNVFDRDIIPVAKGDMIRITKDGAVKRGILKVRNGNRHTVKGFTRDGDIELQDGRVLDKDFAHLAHGYATTSYSAQGKTVDYVFIAESSESFVAGSQQQFYTALSRGRVEPRVYTDDREELLETVQKTSDRLAAADLNFKEEQPPQRWPSWVPEAPKKPAAPAKAKLGTLQKTPTPEVFQPKVEPPKSKDFLGTQRPKDRLEPLPPAIEPKPVEPELEDDRDLEMDMEP